MMIHGGNIYKYPNLLDFSSNVNPLGMSDSVRNAIINSVDICINYPDPECTRLVHAISEFEQIPCRQIVCGNGAADLIYRIVRAFQPKHALIPVPSFSEYYFALRECKCSIQEYNLKPELNFRLDEHFLDYIQKDTDIIFLCTPNNPTGQVIQPDLLKTIADTCIQNDTLLICDECFLRFSENADYLTLRSVFNPNCIILNAFTKLFSMPGLRLGYTLCGSPEHAEKIHNNGQFWSVSVPAQAAGIAALQEKDRISNTVHLIKEERRFLTAQLREAGLNIYESDANFILFNAPPDFAETMKQRGFLIRECVDFHGLDNTFFRIAVRTHDENAALISAVKEVYK